MSDIAVNASSASLHVLFHTNKKLAPFHTAALSAWDAKGFVATGGWWGAGGSRQPGRRCTAAQTPAGEAARRSRRGRCPGAGRCVQRPPQRGVVR